MKIEANDKQRLKNKDPVKLCKFQHTMNVNVKTCIEV